ncbi:MAG: hypothetical protein FWC70_06825 [Defluviitaleaceae bacterium]|nr:hypothetical protein [Defluviitaleaceae bacterium]
MRDAIYTATKCIIALGLSAAAVYFAANNGENAETFKTMTIAAIAYFFTERKKAE